MNKSYIKILGILLNLLIYTTQFAENQNPSLAKPRHTYYAPVEVVSAPNKKAELIGIYQRSAIGNNGPYGVFTQINTTLSQTVLEYDPTKPSISGVTNTTAIGYIQNTKSKDPATNTTPAYFTLYSYKPTISVTKRIHSHASSTPMKTAQYIQK